MSGSSSLHSASEQGLGYIYQGRFALAKILQLPESTEILIEKDDDIDFVGENGMKTLGSLKHKAPGDKLTNLSTDFWKSVRIWLKYYIANGCMTSEVRFFLFTTSTISEDSFLNIFSHNSDNTNDRAQLAQDALTRSDAALLGAIRNELQALGAEQLRDFYDRITIVDASPRITDLPALIKQQMRTIRRESRDAVFERLEGWWTDLVIKLLAGERTDPIYGYNVSDKLAAIAEEYRSDNLPITFRNRLPDGQIDVAKDPRLFVEQLRILELSGERIRSAIIDYYRAFEQRSSWARENLLVSGEIEEYEDRLVEEWGRYREIIAETLHDESDDEACKKAGRDLFNWAQMQTGMLRIRERVTEPYVTRGAFHILANNTPQPRLYWHPRFLDRLQQLLGVAA